MNQRIPVAAHMSPGWRAAPATFHGRSAWHVRCTDPSVVVCVQKSSINKVDCVSGVPDVHLRYKCGPAPQVRILEQ